MIDQFSNIKLTFLMNNWMWNNNYPWLFSIVLTYTQFYMRPKLQATQIAHNIYKMFTKYICKYL